MVEFDKLKLIYNKFTPIAPIKIWPSAPIFHNFTVFMIAIPKPARINGVALFSEELKLLTLPIESLNIKEKVSIGFLSCANKIIEPIINAIKNPAIKE
jgi:hypothetical protein